MEMSLSVEVVYNCKCFTTESLKIRDTILNIINPWLFHSLSFD